MHAARGILEGGEKPVNGAVRCFSFAFWRKRMESCAAVRGGMEAGSPECTSLSPWCRLGAGVELGWVPQASSRLPESPRNKRVGARFPQHGAGRRRWRAGGKLCGVLA